MKLLILLLSTFSDNGIGVDPLIRDRMFDAFVTTTSAPSARADEREYLYRNRVRFKNNSRYYRGI